jgi:hypothetical protein
MFLVCADLDIDNTATSTENLGGAMCLGAQIRPKNASLLAEMGSKGTN